MTRNTIAAIVLLAALCAVIGPAPARGQFLGDGSMFPSAAGNIEGFTVTGKGAAGAKPNRFEIDLEISAASELSADAIVKYRDAKKRLQDAFAGLKMSNVKVEERGLLVNEKGQSFNPYYMDSPPSRKGKVAVQLTRKLVVTCANIREMEEEALLQLVAKLLDVAQDAGGKIGQGGGNMPYYYYYRYGSQESGLVRFILDDFKTVEDQAYQRAIDDARKRAARLARLSGVELGRVLGVREVVVPGDRPTSVNMDEELPRQPDDAPARRIESAKFQDIPVKVELLVRFDAAALPPKARAREGGE